MAAKKISELTAKTPLISDIIPVADPSNGVAGKSTLSQVVSAGLPSQTGETGKFLTTNGAAISWAAVSGGGIGTVTSVVGNGSVNGITLTGNVVTSGNLTLGGALSGVDLGTQTTGTLAVSSGGTGATTAANARTNLNAAILGTNNDITSLTAITGGISSPDFIQFDTGAAATSAVGKLFWDANQGTAALGLVGGNVVSQVGQTLVARVINAESVTITKGQAVYLFSAQGDRATVKLAYNTSDATSAKTLGIAAEDITAGGNGFVMCQGVVDGLNLGAYNPGDTLYLGPTAGSLTATKPYAPNHLVYIGIVERANNGNGLLYVRIQNGYELNEIHDVAISSPAAGQTIIYDKSNSLWKNASLTAGTGMAITNADASITITNNGVTTFSAGTLGFTPLTSTSGAITLNGTLALAHGGTGATNAANARSNLELGNSALLNAGVPNGVATLDSGGSIPTTQLPAAILGSVKYQGIWNASTNSPALASGVGTQGYYYVVSVDGSTNLDGVTTWKVGDWAIFNGTAWQKVDNTDAVTSVNGYTGTVVLNYSDVNAPSVNGANATGSWGIDITGNAANVTGVVSIVNGGTGKTSATDAINALLPDQSASNGKFLTTNGSNVSWVDNPSGTVTQVEGDGTVNGITLTGNVTTSGKLTLGGTLSGVDLTTAVSGILPVTNGGTGTSNGSITGTGELVFTSPANGASISLITANQTPTVGVTTNGGVLNISTGTGYHYLASGPYSYFRQTGRAVINGIEFKTAPSDGYIFTSGNEVITNRDSLFIGRDSAMSIPKTSTLQNPSSCTGVGASTFKNATSPQASVAFGDSACGNGAYYYFSTAIGNGALKENGYYDTAISGASLFYKTTGQSNTGVGFRSLCYGTSFDQTTAIGMDSGAYATSNTAVLLDKATNCVFVGFRSRPLANDATNEIVIGADAVGKGTNSTVIGTTSSNAAWIYGNTLNLGNGASAATITANGALTVTAGGTNQDVTLTPSGTGKINAPAIKETVYTITDGASVDINPANGGIQVWTLGANRTPTASSFAEGQSVTLMVDDGTAYAITWSSISPTWVGGSAPTLATTGYTVIELWKRSSTIYGALVGNA